jgi:hypothetical protein
VAKEVTMSRSLRFAVALALCALAVACGGGAGENSIVGIGNSGNVVSEADHMARGIARALADLEATPEVNDQAIGEIFEAILSRARDGNSEAALIVLRLARQQRNPDEE